LGCWGDGGKWETLWAIKAVAIQTPVPLTDTQRIDRDLKENAEIRITLAGVSGCGKTSLRQTIKAVMGRSLYQMSFDVAARDAVGHGTYFPIQREIPFPKNSKLVVTDLQGLAPAEGINPANVADDLSFINVGLFPSHLLDRPPQLALFEKPLVQKFQHCVALVLSSIEVVQGGDELDYMGKVAQEMRKRQCPFVILLTKVDRIDANRNSIAEIIASVQSATAINKAFIFPIINCSEDGESPKDEVIERVEKAIAKIVETAACVQEDFKAPQHMKVKRWFKDTIRPIRGVTTRFGRKGYVSHIGLTELVLVFLVLVVAVLFYLVVMKKK